MARVSKRSFTFFRLSPVDGNQIRSFAIQRGEITGRIDVTFHQPWIRENLMRVESANFPTQSIRETLTEICYGTGTPPTFYPSSIDTVPFVRATDIKDGQIQLENLLHISSEQPPKMDKCLLNGGEVIVVRSGANTGDSAFVPFELAGSYAAYDLILKFKNTVDPKFVAYFLDTVIGRLQLNLVRGRSAQPHVNAEEVSDIRIVLPDDLNKQIELVAAMDEARSQRKQKLAEADALLDGSDAEILNILGLNIPTLSARNIFATRLSDINQSGRIDVSYHLPFYQTINKVLNSCPYPLPTIGKLCCKPVGGATPRKGDQDLYTDSGIKFLRILNIKTNEIDLTDVKYIKPDVHEGQLKRSQLSSGDVLMTITGRVGTAAVVSENILPANINQHIVRLTMLNDDCLPEYLAAYLNTTLGLTISNRSVTGGTRIALDYGAIQSIPIPLPPKEIQEQVIAVVQQRRSEAQRLRSEAETGWQTAKQWFEEQLLGDS